jgi:hypothetical protein
MVTVVDEYTVLPPVLRKEAITGGVVTSNTAIPESCPCRRGVFPSKTPPSLVTKESFTCSYVVCWLE